jgi:hypothetical protein
MRKTLKERVSKDINLAIGDRQIARLIELYGKYVRFAASKLNAAERARYRAKAEKVMSSLGRLTRAVKHRKGPGA